MASPLWRAQRNAKPLLRRAIRTAASVAGASGELAVMLVDDRAIRALNRNWRGKNNATNVLAFPARSAPARSAPARSAPARSAPARSAPARSAQGGRPNGGRVPIRPLGDVVIAFETVRREADTARVPFGHHLAHLAVHGFLHLIGYDHAAEAEAETMEALETAILARLDVPDPYAAPVAEPDC